MLQEVYYLTYEMPALISSFAVSCNGSRVKKKIFRETLHLALLRSDREPLIRKDLETLGADLSFIEESLPLPETMALISYSQYQITSLKAKGFFGIVFALNKLEQKLAAEIKFDTEVPFRAFSYFSHANTEHFESPDWNRHFKTLIETPDDLEAISYAMRLKTRFYALILSGVFRDQEAPFYRSSRQR